MNASTPPPAPAPRIDALDAFRGFAILTMILSGLVPRSTLPSWMYHAQIPPPEHLFDPALPGLTWVDLVFPFFLFALGAAIPFALSRRIAGGAGRLRIVGQVLLRGVLLLAFAVYIPHVDPWRLAGEPHVGTWLLGLLAFGLMFPALARLPRAWSRGLRLAVRTIGWGGAAALVAGWWYVGGADAAAARADGVLAFVNRVAERSDIIIVVLANVAVWASLIWLVTRHNVAARLVVMIALLGLRLAHDQSGWIQTLWDWHPVPRLYQLYFAQYLLIVLPGTIAGDLFRSWQRAPEPADASTRWSNVRLGLLAGVALVVNVFVVCGLHARWLPWATPAGTAVLAVAALLLVRGAEAGHAALLSRLVRWGVVWLIIGLVFEPYEGGIKKDHATVSYYFVTSGLACFALVFLTVLIDRFRCRRMFGVLIDNGCNPMIAYLGIRNLLPLLLVPTGIEGWVAAQTPGPWLGVLWAILKTTLLAYIVRWITRRGVYWRT